MRPPEGEGWSGSTSRATARWDGGPRDERGTEMAGALREHTGKDDSHFGASAAKRKHCNGYDI
ncbi:hypothetical protein GCM10010478_01410 [Streptomyces erythrogriseus]|uniref:Uncharacterized protein n=3 Tax=Streptomyces TaxID=1883 RepID=A0ABN3W8G7_9ACTN|nr:hypothetical protein GCM10010265_46680 [Streptomyces griseoincarnatus]GGT51693.1 hypothetical protein GCM10010287_27140 [Streptomyces variabilis]